MTNLHAYSRTAFWIRTATMWSGVVYAFLRFGPEPGEKAFAAGVLFELMEFSQRYAKGSAANTVSAVLVFLQVAILTALFLAPSPFGLASLLTAPLTMQSPLFLFFLCFLATTISPPRPWVTLSAGAAILAGWTVIRYCALADPATIVKADIDISRYKTPIALLTAITGPHYFNADVWRVNLFLISIITATLVFAAFRMDRLAKRTTALQASRDALSAYFSPQIVEVILNSASRALEPQERRVTVLDCDLVGFTHLAETLAPEDVAKTLKAYRGVAEDAVLSRDGAIVSHQGDGFKAVFGLTGDGRGAVDAALKASLQILEAWPKAASAASPETPPALAIGIDFGSARVGLVGEGRTLTLLMLGEPVDGAARLQAATRGRDTRILLSEEAAAEFVREGHSPAEIRDAAVERGA